jgi:hypothetical protein
MTDEIKQLPTFDFNVQLTAQLRNGDEYQTGFTKKNQNIFPIIYICSVRVRKSKAHKIFLRNVKLTEN